MQSCIMLTIFWSSLRSPASLALDKNDEVESYVKQTFMMTVMMIVFLLIIIPTTTSLQSVSVSHLNDSCLHCLIKTSSDFKAYTLDVVGHCMCTLQNYTLFKIHQKSDIFIRWWLTNLKLNEVFEFSGRSRALVSLAASAASQWWLDMKYGRNCHH